MSSVDTERAAGTSRRRVVLVIVIAVVLVLVAAAAITWGVLRTSRGPVDAVREYVDLIAAGDVAEASRTVDPSSYSGYVGEGEDPEPVAEIVDPGSPVTASDDLVLDPAQLTAVAAKAAARPEITDVDLDYGAVTDVPVGSTVDVEVEYTVDGVPGDAVLRAERLDDTWFGFTRWRVVDPLLVPLVVQSNLPELGPAEVGESAATTTTTGTTTDPAARPAVAVPAEVDLSGLSVEGASQRATLLYPGTYELSSPISTYLSADPETVVVSSGRAASSGSGHALGDVVQATLAFRATPALTDRVQEESAGFLDACFAALPSPPADCPADLRSLAPIVADIALTEAPEVDGITTYQVPHPQGVAATPPMRATFTPGEFGYTSEDGQRDDATFLLYALVIPDGDDVSIEFRPRLTDD